MLDKKARIRPAYGGVSIGHYKVTAGTLGCLVIDKYDGVYILSNNHVLSNSNDAQKGDPIYQPGTYDSGSDTDTIALLEKFIPVKFQGESGCRLARTVARFLNVIAWLFRRKTRFKLISIEIPENEVDCAIAKPFKDEDVSPEIVDIGRLKGVARVKVGDKVQKSGRTSCHTKDGVVVDDDASIDVSYGAFKTARFIHQILISKEGFSAPGDSGSLIVNEDRYAVGLLFAGSDTVTLANHIETVEEYLGVRVL